MDIKLEWDAPVRWSVNGNPLDWAEQQLQVATKEFAAIPTGEPLAGAKLQEVSFSIALVTKALGDVQNELKKLEQRQQELYREWQKACDQHSQHFRQISTGPEALAAMAAIASQSDELLAEYKKVAAGPTSLKGRTQANLSALTYSQSLIDIATDIRRRALTEGYWADARTELAELYELDGRLQAAQDYLIAEARKIFQAQVDSSL